MGVLCAAKGLVPVDPQRDGAYSGAVCEAFGWQDIVDMLVYHDTSRVLNDPTFHRATLATRLNTFMARQDFSPSYVEQAAGHNPVEARYCRAICVWFHAVYGYCCAVEGLA